MKTLHKEIHHLLWVMVAILSFSCSSNRQTELTEKKHYEPESIVYSLNLLSNIMFGVDAKDSVLLNSAPLAINGVLNDPTVVEKIGTWSIAWGPVLFSKYGSNCNDTCVVDNLLVLFKNESKENGVPDYVLATSGTNDISSFGWFHEDFDAYQMKQWPQINDADSISDFIATLSDNPPCTTNCDQSQALVSLGTSVGVLKLLNMKNADSLTIYESLNKIIAADNSSNLELRVVGHSLGGALSPALALVLSQYQSSWDVSKKVKVSTAPTAGASPGNEAFRTYFFDQIAVGNFYGKMNLNDLVPHAWQDSFLPKIPDLYAGEQGIDNVCLIDSLIGFVKNKLNSAFDSNNYASLYCIDDKCSPSLSTTYSFLHPYHNNIDIPDAKSFIYECCMHKIEGEESPTKCELIYESKQKYNDVMIAVGCANSDPCNEIGITLLYLDQAVYQHTTAYTEQYGVTTVANSMKSVKSHYNLKTPEPEEQQAALFTALLDYINNDLK